jgi:hypothetical protein
MYGELGVLACHAFRCNLNRPYYVDMLENSLLSASRQQFCQKWRLQQDNDPKQFINYNN